MSPKNSIVIETGPKKTFASALDWPGWSRKGNSEDDAINVLIQYLERYGKVTELAGVNGIDALVKSSRIWADSMPAILANRPLTTMPLSKASSAR